MQAPQINRVCGGSREITVEKMPMLSNGYMLVPSSPASAATLLRPAPPFLSLPVRRLNRIQETISLHSAARRGKLPRTFPAAAASQSSPATNETFTDEMTDAALPSSLLRESLPRHVAIIMDGNSRWAQARGLPISAGHEAGYRSLKEIVRLSCSWGIRVLTVFAFSSENWFRPKNEVNFLMTLFEGVLKENVGDFVRESIKVRIIGDFSKLPKSLQKLAKEVQDITDNNCRFELIVAVSYSGRQEIVLACQKIAQKVKNRLLEPEEITESLFAQELETNYSGDFPYPDLLIRTSGELRLSNFLLWQSAYSELFFTKTNWPDFGEADYIEALHSFQRRQRRFGQRAVQEWMAGVRLALHRQDILNLILLSLAGLNLMNYAQVGGCVPCEVVTCPNVVNLFAKSNWMKSCLYAVFMALKRLDLYAR